MPKALKITIEGSYKTSKGETVDFDEITGVIPFVNDSEAKMHVIGRYALPWIKSAEKHGKKLYTERVENVRQVFLNDIEEIDHDGFSYVGVDIKKMTYDQLQDLATANNLMRVPLPKEISGMSIREIRERAYIAYADAANGNLIDIHASDYDYSKLSPLFADGEKRSVEVGKLTNEELLDQEQKSPDPKSGTSNLTLDDLKKIADDKNIKYHPSIGFDALHKKIFSASF